jgi:hypothetical protein
MFVSYKTKLVNVVYKVFLFLHSILKSDVEHKRKSSFSFERFFSIVSICPCPEKFFSYYSLLGCYAL